MHLSSPPQEWHPRVAGGRWRTLDMLECAISSRSATYRAASWHLSWPSLESPHLHYFPSENCSPSSTVQPRMPSVSPQPVLHARSHARASCASYRPAACRSQQQGKASLCAKVSLCALPYRHSHMKMQRLPDNITSSACRQRQAEAGSSAHYPADLCCDACSFL